MNSPETCALIKQAFEHDVERFPFILDSAALAKHDLESAVIKSELDFVVARNVRSGAALIKINHERL